MPRRRFLLALAVIIPLAIFGAAKIAVRWRPVEIGRIYQRGVYPVPVIAASSRLVEAYGPLTSRFDLQTRKQSYVGRDAGILPAGAWSWSVLKNDPRAPTRGQMQLHHDGKTTSFPIPIVSAGSIGETSAQAVAWVPADNRLQLVMGRRYYRWNLQSGALEWSQNLPVFDTSLMAFSRDGQTLSQAGLHEVSAFSTRTGRQKWRVRFGSTAEQLPTQISMFGRYAIYDNSRVVNLRNGRTLWRFANSTVSAHRAAFSPDEKFIAFPIAARKIWQLRDAQTSQLLRTLPLVPGATTAAFSPDGATLYSVAGGVLYRQRAR